MKKYLFLLPVLFILLLSRGAAQIVLLPPAVFIDPEKKTGSLGIKNTSSEAREADISFQFGYVKYDSLGLAYIEYGDSLLEKTNSLIPYIKVFPKKVIIPPNEEQKVRFLVSHPPDLPDGAYWTRIIVGLDPIEQQVDTVPGTKITTGLVLSSKIVGAAMYFKGEIQSGLDIPSIHSNRDSQNVNIFVHYKRTVGMPFLGQISIKILDSDDNVIQEQNNKYCVVYKDGVQKFPFDAKNFKKGKYKVEIRVDTDREDIPEKFRIPFTPFNKSFEFSI